jgi:integrase
MTEAAQSKLHEIVLGAHGLATSTRDRYVRDLNQWIDFAGPEPHGWTRERARDFYNALLERMKPQSANRLMASVAYASRWFAHYANNPGLDFAKVQTAKPKDKKTQFAITEEEAQSLLASCDNTPIGARDFALLVVGLETGMRRMSLEGMTIEDTLLLPSPRWPCPATLVPLKGQDPNWVPLSDTATIAINLWLNMLANLRTRSGASAAVAGPLFRPLTRRIVGVSRVFVAETRPLSESAITKILHERSKGRVNPHLLRHTFITWRTEIAKLKPHEIAAITHHDLSKLLGALGGYMDLRALGAESRNHTPRWLVELVQRRAH